MFYQRKRKQYCGEEKNLSLLNSDTRDSRKFVIDILERLLHFRQVAPSTEIAGATSIPATSVCHLKRRRIITIITIIIVTVTVMPSTITTCSIRRRYNIRPTYERIPMTFMLYRNSNHLQRHPLSPTMYRGLSARDVDSGYPTGFISKRSTDDGTQPAYSALTVVKVSTVKSPASAETAIFIAKRTTTGEFIKVLYHESLNRQIFL